MKVTDEMVDRFLNWPLPKSVCSDECVTTMGYPNRIGTNLLTADEARQMLEYVLSETQDTNAAGQECRETGGNHRRCDSGVEGSRERGGEPRVNIEASQPLLAPAAQSDKVGTPRTDSTAVMVVNDQPFPLGHLAMEPYEAVPADFARQIERELAAMEERAAAFQKLLGFVRQVVRENAFADRRAARLVLRDIGENDE